MNIYKGYLIFIFLIEITEIEIDIVLFTFSSLFTFLLFYQALQYLMQFSITNPPETRFESQGDC